MIKAKVAFWRAGFFSANESFLKTFQIALIGWIKAGHPKSYFCFDHVNRLNINWLVLFGRTIFNFVIMPTDLEMATKSYTTLLTVRHRFKSSYVALAL